MPEAPIVILQQLFSRKQRGCAALWIHNLEIVSHQLTEKGQIVSSQTHWERAAVSTALASRKIGSGKAVVCFVTAHLLQQGLKQGCYQVPLLLSGVRNNAIRERCLHPRYLT